MRGGEALPVMESSLPRAPVKGAAAAEGAAEGACVRGAARGAAKSAAASGEMPLR